MDNLRSHTDKFIEQKIKEFEKYLEKIYKKIELARLEFKSAMEELRRKHLEIEREHEQHLKDFDEASNNIENAWKSNNYKIQSFCKQMLRQAKFQKQVFEQEKETPRMLIEFDENLITNFPPLFYIEPVKQPDYSKKTHVMQKICRGKPEYGPLYGCDCGFRGSRGSAIYLADYMNNQIQVVTKMGEFLSPLKGVTTPWGVKVNKELVYVTERDTGQLKVLSTEGKLKWTKRLDARGIDPGKAMSIPLGIDVDNQGRVYIADSGLRIVHILDSNKHYNSVGKIKHESLLSPQDVKVVGDRVYVLDAAGKMVKVFNRDGELVESLLTDHKKISPEFFTVDKLGNMLICNQKECCIELYDDQETLFHTISCELSIPGGITLRKNGEIVVSCNGEDMCYVF